MGARTVGRRAKVLLGLLGLCIVAWGYAEVDARALEDQLKSIARTKILEHREAGGSETVGLQYASTVTAFKEYILFGETHGKVSVFIKAAAPGHADKLAQLDFFYTRTDEGWKMTESGGCGGEECRINAQRAFAKLDRD